MNNDKRSPSYSNLHPTPFCLPGSSLICVFRTIAWCHPPFIKPSHGPSALPNPYHSPGSQQGSAPPLRTSFSFPHCPFTMLPPSTWEYTDWLSFLPFLVPQGLCTCSPSGGMLSPLLIALPPHSLLNETSLLLSCLLSSSDQIRERGRKLVGLYYFLPSAHFGFSLLFFLSDFLRYKVWL